jgi:RNA polymerase sigma-70 factor (ECF subfamily)
LQAITREPAGPEESELLDALRRGDEDAFGRLVNEHHASLRRVARLYVANAATADEVVQETWLGVIRGIWAFEGRSSLKTWIFRILVNRARTRALRESRRARVTDTFSTEGDTGVEPSASPERVLAVAGSLAPGPVAQPPLDPASSPERSLLTKELGERLQTAVDAIPPNLRAVLWLRDVEGWSAAEVCNALAIQETNQRVLLHRARARVRAALEPYLKEVRECV